MAGKGEDILRAGKLRNKLIIESQSIANDAYGAPARTWSTFATVWGSVNPFTGREWFESGKVSSEVSTKITIRYLANITAQMRVKFGTRIYNIIAILKLDELNKEMHLMCKEVI